MLTREDDIAAARPRPMTHHVMKAGLDDKGNLVGWHHRLVAENVDAVAAPPRFQATGGKRLHRLARHEQEFYTIPNVQADAMREHARHARARLARHRRGLQQVRQRSLPRRGGAAPPARIRSHMRLELTKDQPRARSRDQGRGARCRTGMRKRDGPRPRHRVLRLPRHAHGGRRRGLGRQEHRQDQGPQLLDRGRSGPRDPAARTSHGPARKRDRLRAARPRCRRS